MRLQVNIERLVLEGVDPAAVSATHIQAALARELRQQVSGGAWDPASVSSGALASIPLTSVNISPNNSATQIARAIAQALRSGLTK